ncbi:MAG TPA: hypothetical protein VGS21_04970 [Acidimicrobiales bacterium]|nr:hypothetical protein [Acidimicrobiales bacterium]
MIVRILDDGQFEIGDAEVGALEADDAALGAAIEAGDEAQFESALAKLIDYVHENGSPLDPTTITPSSLTIPRAGATLAEVRELLDSEELAEG